MSEDTTKPQAPSAAFMTPRIDKDAPEGGPKSKKRGRRKVSYLTLQKITSIDYKDVALLKSKFLNDRGKIQPSRQTGNTAKQQRMVAEAIRRAREMALIPFVVTDTSADRRPPRPRRDDWVPQSERTQERPAEKPAAE